MITVRWDVTKGPDFKSEGVPSGPSPSGGGSADVDVAINPVVTDDEQVMKRWF